jgi:hypothetical protein
MPRSLSPRSGPDHDRVMTPQHLAEYCVRELQPTGRILEPCRGSGVFWKALNKPLWCELDEGRDFLQWTEPVDWIITNPPWSQFRPFLGHAMTLAPNIAFLVTVNHWWTKARVRMVQDAGFGYRQMWLLGTVAEFPPSGFEVGLMYVQRGYDGPLAITYGRPE